MYARELAGMHVNVYECTCMCCEDVFNITSSCSQVKTAGFNASTSALRDELECGSGRAAEVFGSKPVRRAGKVEALGGGGYT